MESINQILARELNREQTHIDNVIRLLDEGNTIPFIARYRKELHGAMDDTALRTLADRLEYLRSLQERRETVKKSIEEQGKLTEELNAAIDRALKHLDENGGHTLTLERIPETAHTLASIAYAVFFFGWAKMPEMLSAIQRDFTGHEQLKQQLADVPAYGEGDDFQDSLGLQIAGVFNKRVTAHRTPDGQAVEAITPVE